MTRIDFLILILCAAVLGAPAFAQQSQRTPRFDFGGKLLIVASDTDMLASAYQDGKLGPAVGSDVLSTIRLDGGRTPMRTATVEVTNSVTGPPAAVAVTPDGKYAIAVETQGPRAAGKPEATMNDLAPGKKITVVDLQDPDKPKVVQQVESYERAVSVSVNPAGTLVAVAFAPKTAPKQPPLVLYRFRNGRLFDPLEPSVPGFMADDRLVDVEFLPKQDALAVVYETSTHPRLSFVKYATSETGIALQPWGNTLELDRSPFLVKFTPDGRFAIVNSMYGQNVRGTLTSIQLADSSAGEAEPKHLIVSHTEAGELPEGLAISPNGRWVATANLESSYYPWTDSHQKFFASLSLLRLDPATGVLQRVGDFAFDGVLPEPLVFDNSSRFIAAASFEQFDNPKAGGSINFWRIADNNDEPGRVELVKLNESIPVARGPQSMAIVR